MNRTERLLLIDGNNILIRSMFASQGSKSVMSSDDGVPTGALVVFVNQLSKVIRRTDPDRVVICWDGGKSEYRMEIFAGYKAARNNVGPPVEIKDSAWDLAKNFLTLANIHHVMRPGVEADDLIAHLWRKVQWRKKVTIFSGDKDFLQLADGWSEQLMPGDDEPWTSNRIRSVHKAKPCDLAKVMALTGDNVDNVPGVPMIGPKKAVALLYKYNWDLEELLHAHERPLIGWEDNIRRNLKLIDLRNAGPRIDLDMAPRFNPTYPTGPGFSELLAFLDRYQLESIRTRLLAGVLWKDRSEVPA